MAEPTLTPEETAAAGEVATAAVTAATQAAESGASAAAARENATAAAREAATRNELVVSDDQLQTMVNMFVDALDARGAFAPAPADPAAATAEPAVAADPAAAEPAPAPRKKSWAERFAGT